MMTTLAKYVLPVLSLGLLAFAMFYVLNAREPPPPAVLPEAPPEAPFARTVAAAGVVEAQTENISVGAPLAGIVVEVFVEVGQRVNVGDPLFRLDDRALQATLAAREAQVAASAAEVERLRREPRPERVPVAEAQVREAQAALEQARDRLQRVQQVIRTGAATEQELVQARSQFNSAQATLQRSQAELTLLKEGTWEYELQVAEARLAQSRAEAQQIATELERLVVRALIAGEVLQVNVRPGEFVAAEARQPLILLGNTRQLRVRVDIDEYDISRFTPGATALATLKGNADVTFPLEFVRVEPFVVPKRSLTGENTERVDTRVLQVIYEVKQGSDQLYVGQQVDVFINAAPPVLHPESPLAEPAGS